MPVLPHVRPTLAVVIDTEGKFDWHGPFNRASTSVEHMRRIGPLQDLFERWGVRPLYAIDYSVASQEAGVAALAPLVRDGRALVGAHLHPWVSPPDEEEVCTHNSFPGNLPPALERQKLERLTERIEAAMGVRPVIYKAGRYGIGPNTFAILETLGYTVDVSPAPPFNYHVQGGPDFSYRGLAPRWEGPRGTVLSIPGTGALVGHLPWMPLYNAAARLAPLQIPGVLSRLGIIERIRLSPEGHSSAEMCRLVRWLHARGQQLFVLGLHSPSVEPGNTPYVQTEAELTAFMATIEDFLRFFMSELDGAPTDAIAIRAATLPTPS